MGIMGFSKGLKSGLERMKNRGKKEEEK